MRQTENKTFYRRLFILALPIIGQDMLNALVNMLDTFMIGSLGGTAITAVGLSNQLFFVYILLVFGVSSGSAILMGQYHGAGDVKSIRKTLGLAVGISVVISFLFAFFAVFHPELIMRIYSKDPAVIAEGVKYLRIVGPAYILGAFTVPINTALKSMNAPKLPMFTTAIALLVNVTLNYTFIFILKMGVAGAAYGTLTARSVELIAQIVIIRGTKVPLWGKFKDFFKADKAFFKRYLTLASPVIINEGIWAVGTSMYNAAYKYCGTDAQTALQITATVQNLFWVIGMGIGSASGIILANTLGAGEKDKAISYSRKIYRAVIIAGVTLGVLFFALSPLITNLFNVNPEVKLIARRLSYVISAVLIIKLLNFTSIVGVLRSGGDTFFCMMLDLAAVWAVGVPLAFLGARVLGLPIYFVFLMVQAEEVLKIITAFPRSLKNGWAKTLV